MLGFHLEAIGRQETNQFSAFYFFLTAVVHTNQCECEGDCPGNRDSDEVPDRILEATTDEYPFIE